MFVVVLNIRPYQYNLTSIFHSDEVVTGQNLPMPSGFVILKVPSYDGAQYYQIARNIPKIFSPSRWDELQEKPPGSYAYQRFLLPLTAYVLSLGHEAALPYAFLLINVLALLAAAGVMLHRQKTIYAFALCLSPAAIIAMHFTLAEPLTILLITLVLLRYTDKKKIEWFDVLLLSLLVLAREVNILFIAYLIGFSVLKKNWRDCLRLLIPAAVFLCFHTIIFGIFGNIPFLISAEAKVFPFSEPVKNLLGVYGYDRMSLSAIALFLGFVLPGLFWTVREILTTKKLEILPLGALFFFGIMLVMPHYIWGSITSIGRVITPVYPLYILAIAKRDTHVTRTLAFVIILIGLATVAGLALSIHPYMMTM